MERERSNFGGRYPRNDGESLKIMIVNLGERCFAAYRFLKISHRVMGRGKKSISIDISAHFTLKKAKISAAVKLFGIREGNREDKC